MCPCRREESPSSGISLAPGLHGREESLPPAHSSSGPKFQGGAGTMESRMPLTVRVEVDETYQAASPRHRRSRSCRRISGKQSPGTSRFGGRGGTRFRETGGCGSSSTPRCRDPNPRRVIAAQERFGWNVRSKRGSHVHLVHGERPWVVLTFPVHTDRGVSPGTLRSLLRTAGISVDEFSELL